MPVQKDKGWEFTDLVELDLERLRAAGRRRLSAHAQPRAGRRRATAGRVLQVDGAAERRGGELPDGVIVAHARARRSPSTPSWSSRTSAASCCDRDKFSAQNTRALAGRRVRLRAGAACASRRRSSLSGDPGDAGHARCPGAR